MDKWKCVCSYVYDPAKGDPDNGVEPGTPWKRCRMTGTALFVANQKICLKRCKV